MSPLRVQRSQAWAVLIAVAPSSVALSVATSDLVQCSGCKHLVGHISQRKYVYTFLFELPKKGPFENYYLACQFQVETFLHLHSEGICPCHVFQGWLVNQQRDVAICFQSGNLFPYCTLDCVFFHKSLTEVSTAGTEC